MLTERFGPPVKYTPAQCVLALEMIEDQLRLIMECVQTHMATAEQTTAPEGESDD